MTPISQARVLELFRVDFDAGKIYWRSPPKERPDLLDREAGAPTGDARKRYWGVGIDGRRSVKRGHIVYLAALGVWPLPMLDHINGDSLDDRLVNLRIATAAENAQNVRARPRDLPQGVSRSASGQFRARIRHNGRLIWLGIFRTPDLAAAAYLAKRKELFGAFA
jgi:hypothetical protein